MQFLKRYGKMAFTVLALFAVLFSVSACSSTNNGTGQSSESQAQQSNYDKLVAKDPAHTMNYSPTRKTINFWIDTWNKPGQLAYVYLMNESGDLIGYYVLQGPPVSMCTSLTPNYKIVQDAHDNGQMSVPAPGIDGVYYSGGECNTYYGQDAQTGAYVEFTLGMSMNMLLYNQPLTNHQNVPDLTPPKSK